MTNINQIIKDEFLFDIKQDKEPLNKFLDAVERILKRYEIEDGNYEISDFAKQKYEKLNWNYYKDYDIAIPLWSTLTAAMVERSSRHGDEIKNKGQFLYQLDKNGIEYYVYNPSTNLYEYMYLSKKILGKKYFYKANIHHKALDEVVHSYPQIAIYSAISDSIANFMPCPPFPYNSAKGFLQEVKDYLPLMINYIQTKKESIQSENKKDSDIIFQTDSFVVKVKDIKDWYDWFVDNREKCFLEDFYVIDENESGNVRIKGIPLFKGQDLNNPLPKEQGEIEECLKNLIIITINRALKMACDINNNS